MFPSGKIPLANIQGEILPLTEVRISVLDRGFLFGDSIYEVLRVYRGRPFLEEEHWQRLARSLDAIRLPGIDLVRLRHRMHETLRASNLKEALIYLQITRGSAPRTHAFPKDSIPLELLWVQEYADYQAEARRIGAYALTQPDLRWERCDIKSTNLLANILAMQAAKESGAIEALFYLPDGTLTEGSHSNLFGVQHGKLLTYPLSNAILPGVTRQLIVRLAQRCNIPLVEQPINRGQLDRLDELFLSGTTAEVMPLVRVDGKPIASGTPGPLTQRLQAAYREAISE